MWNSLKWKTSHPKNVTFWPRRYKTFWNGKKCDDSAGTVPSYLFPSQICHLREPPVLGTPPPQKKTLSLQYIPISLRGWRIQTESLLVPEHQSVGSLELLYTTRLWPRKIYRSSHVVSECVTLLLCIPTYRCLLTPMHTTTYQNTNSHFAVYTSVW
jgi:hypothetical protein